MKQFYSALSLGIISFIFVHSTTKAQTKSTFEDLLTDPSTYWNGQSSSYGSFSSVLEDSIFQFGNSYSRNDFGFGFFESWSGMAYSKMKDDTTAAFTNQYSAITAGGAFNSENYAVFYTGSGADTIKLTEKALLDSVFITNGTYPYLSMRDGDMFAKKFGGESGDDPDWFLLTITGLNDGLATDTIQFYLADFRDPDKGNDYIVDEWTKVDLSVLDSVDMLQFSLSSSDVGDFGMNTPAYFCMDNLSGADFENLTFTSGEVWNGKTASFGTYRAEFTDALAGFPNSFSLNDFGFGPFEAWSGFAYSSMQDDSTAGFSNQYSAYPASGANGSNTYALCYNSRGRDTVKFSTPLELTGTFITNGTYGVKSMQEGDMFSKKFGGESGDDPDWFMLTIRGINGGAYTDSVEFYLADYRFENKEEDYIVTEWEFVDLSGLGEVEMIEFSLSSSDVGDFGMNTPAYFFIDDLNDRGPVVASPIGDLTVNVNAPDEVIDLSATFSDADDDDASMELSVYSNSGDQLVSTSLEGSQLTLSFTEDQSGEASIEIMALSNGQSMTTSFTVTVDVLKSVEQQNLDEMNLYPNPTPDNFHVLAPRSGEWTLDIYNSLGQKVASQLLNGGEERIRFEDQPAGVYHVVMYNETGQISRHLIKK